MSRRQVARNHGKEVAARVVGLIKIPQQVGGQRIVFRGGRAASVGVVGAEQPLRKELPSLIRRFFAFDNELLFAFRGINLQFPRWELRFEEYLAQYLQRFGEEAAEAADCHHGIVAVNRGVVVDAVKVEQLGNLGCCIAGSSFAHQVQRSRGGEGGRLVSGAGTEHQAQPNERLGSGVNGPQSDAVRQGDGLGRRDIESVGDAERGLYGAV